MFIIDVKSSYNLTGKQAETILSNLNITVNKNSIPNDTEKPMITSGIRLGSAAMTSRGFKEDEFIIIADLIDKALLEPNNISLHNVIKKEISKIANSFTIKKFYLMK